MTIRIKIYTEQILPTLLLYYVTEVMVLFCVSLQKGVPGKPASGHADTLHTTCLAVLSHVETL